VTREGRWRWLTQPLALAAVVALASAGALIGWRIGQSAGAVVGVAAGLPAAALLAVVVDRLGSAPLARFARRASEPATRRAPGLRRERPTGRG
jgi:hypothetical protein